MAHVALPLEAHVGATLKQQPVFSIRALKIQKQSIVWTSCTASLDVCGLLQATVRDPAGRCVRLYAAQVQCRKGTLAAGSHPSVLLWTGKRLDSLQGTWPAGMISN